MPHTSGKGSYRSTPKHPKMPDSNGTMPPKKPRKPAKAGMK